MSRTSVVFTGIIFVIIAAISIAYFYFGIPSNKSVMNKFNPNDPMFQKAKRPKPNENILPSKTVVKNRLEDTTYEAKAPHLMAPEVIKRLITLFQTKNIEELSSFVIYPLKREHPIPRINNHKEFINRFSEVFDEKLINTIIHSDVVNDWGAVGFKGIMLHNGTLWLNFDGQIIAINYQSTFESELKTKIINSQKKMLHSSVKDFDAPILAGKTLNHKIRIDNLNNKGYRYASWSINKEISDKPDLIIFSGEMEMQGSAGNTYYRFKNKNYAYEISVTYVGKEEGNFLTVYKDNQVISEEAIND